MKNRVSLKLVTYPWDYLSPLACGDVVPEGIDLEIDRASGIQALFTDPSLQGGESSIGHFMLRASQGNRDWVGLPIFVMRAFRHRCFLVPRGSDLDRVDDLSRLEGRRVGIDGWPNTGNTWTRIVMAEGGADFRKVNWVLGQIDGPIAVASAHAPPIDLPPNVTPAPAGRTLVDLLLAGELDVLVAAFMPARVFEQDSPIVHMIPDFPAAERAYMGRVGYIPAHHLLTIRRDVIERDPWIAASMMEAFEETKRVWRAQRRKLADTTPWVLADLEATAMAFGDDWQLNGTEPNVKMLTDFCQGQ